MNILLGMFGKEFPEKERNATYPGILCSINPKRGTIDKSARELFVAPASQRFVGVDYDYTRIDNELSRHYRITTLAEEYDCVIYA